MTARLKDISTQDKSPGFKCPELFNHKSGVEKYGVGKFIIEKSGVEKSMVEISGVGKFMVEKSGVERSGVEAWG
jgi:hypothetical protein